MPLLGINVIRAHVLPARSRMAMENCEAGSGLSSLNHSPFKIPRLETGIAVDAAIARARQNEAVQERRLPPVAVARIPFGKTEILLPVAAY